MIKLSSLCTTPAPVEYHDQDSSFQGAALHKNEHMSDRSRTGVLIPITNGYVKRTCENDLALPSTQRLENAGPGAAAHMSLHLELTMSKSAKDRRLGLPSFWRATTAPRF